MCMSSLQVLAYGQAAVRLEQSHLQREESSLSRCKCILLVVEIGFVSSFGSYRFGFAIVLFVSLSDCALTVLFRGVVYVVCVSIYSVLGIEEMLGKIKRKRIHMH